MKAVSFTCDITDGEQAHAAVYAIRTELQNGSTVFSVNERHACNNPSHVGYLVLGEGSLVDLIQEATKSDPKGKYPVDAWRVVGVKVTQVAP